MSDGKVGATVEYPEELLKEISDLRKLAEKTLGPLDATVKSNAERTEEAMKRLETVERLMKETKPRSFGFPERDARAFKFQPTQKGFDRLMRGVTPPHQRNTDLGVLVDMLRKAHDELYIASILWGGMAKVPDLRSHLPEGEKIKVGDDGPVICKGSKIWKEYADLQGELMKALDTATAGEGAEWIPTGMGSVLYQLVVEELRVGAQFMQIEMPQDPWEWPFETARPVATKASEATGTANPYDSLTPEMYGAGEPTANRQFKTVKMRALHLTSRELNDDSIIAIMPYLQTKVVQALAEGRETTTISGDDTATHMDDDVDGLAATDIRKSWKGLRKTAIDRSATLDINAFDTSKMRELIKVGGVHLRRPDGTILITGNAGYWQLMDNADVLTVDKYGPAATILAGELGRFDNRPILVSDFMPENLASTGVNTAAGPNDKTGIIVVRTGSFFYGHRPGLGVETERLKVSDQFLILAFDRLDFKNPEPTTTKPVAFGINLAL